MSQAKKSKSSEPKKDRSQRTIAQMFGEASSLNDDVDESKQNVLIEMIVNQVKNENGNDWTLLFDFDFHFLASNSQRIDSERDVEIDSTSTSRASSAPTSRSGSPMEIEDDDENSDSNTANTGSSEGWLVYESTKSTIHYRN